PARRCTPDAAPAAVRADPAPGRCGLPNSRAGQVPTERAGHRGFWPALPGETGAGRSTDRGRQTTTVLPAARNRFSPGTRSVCELPRCGRRHSAAVPAVRALPRSPVTPREPPDTTLRPLPDGPVPGPPPRP